MFQLLSLERRAFLFRQYRTEKEGEKEGEKSVVFIWEQLISSIDFEGAL